MAVSRCPHCQQLLLPDELLAPTCTNCGGALSTEPPKAVEPSAPAPTPQAAPPPQRTPWLLWAAVALLALSNVGMLAWILWHDGTARPTANPLPTALVDPAQPPEPTPPAPSDQAGKDDASKPADKPAPDAPLDQPAKPPAPMPAPPPPPGPALIPPMPMPPPAAPPAVAFVPPPPIIMPDLTNIEGMQGRVDCNAAGDVVALRLGNSGLGDNDLILLQPFDRLRDLNLDHTLVSDKGMVYLKRLKELRSVGLRGANVTGAGLGEASGLTSLDLGETPITDAGLENLRGLTELRKLNLSKTQITDAGLACLKELTQLSVVNLGGTKVTDAGVAALQKALPGVKIIR